MSCTNKLHEVTMPTCITELDLYCPTLTQNHGYFFEFTNVRSGKVYGFEVETDNSHHVSFVLADSFPADLLNEDGIVMTLRVKESLVSENYLALSGAEDGYYITFTNYGIESATYTFQV